MAEISAKAVKELRDQSGAGMMDCKRALKDADGDASRASELLRERGLAKAGKREGRATSEGVVALQLDGNTGGLVELGCETDFVARTDAFVELAEGLAAAVAGDAALDSPKALLEGALDGEKIADRVTHAITKLGENVVVKRVARLCAADPGRVGGYIHAGGKLGVLVALDTSADGAEVASLAKDIAMHVAAVDPTPVAISRDGVPAELLESEATIYRNQAAQSGKPEKIIERIVEGRLNKFTAEICLTEQAFVKDPDCSVADHVRAVCEKVGAEISVSGFSRFKLGETSEA